MASVDISGGGVPSLTNTLTDTHIFVGDINNEPQDVALTLSATGGAFALANTGVLTMPNADATTRGLLTASDWITFNNKQNAIPDWTTGFGSGTQATSTWTATNAAANVNAAIVPKGTGAIVAQLPDGTITGGNSRGQYSVDLQRIRTAATQVASGNYSVVAGGQNNTASGINTFIGSGINNQATNSYSSVVGGQGNSCDDRAGGFIGGGGGNSIGNNRYCAILGGNGNSIGGGDIRSSIAGGLLNSLATSEFSFIGGGQENTCNGNAFIVGGYQNTAGSSSGRNFIGAGNNNTANASGSSVVGGSTNAANGSFSAVLGGANSVANLYGQQSYAAGRFSANGDAQAHELIWRRSITGTAQTELFLDGASIAAILPTTNTAWHGIIDICSICTVAGSGTTVLGDVAATSYKATIKRLNTNTTIVGTVQEIGTTNADTSMATVVFTIDANNTNESLRIQFTPPATAAADTVIRVVATFRGTQIKY